MAAVAAAGDGAVAAVDVRIGGATVAEEVEEAPVAVMHPEALLGGGGTLTKKGVAKCPGVDPLPLFSRCSLSWWI